MTQLRQKMIRAMELQKPLPTTHKGPTLPPSQGSPGSIINRLIR